MRNVLAFDTASPSPAIALLWRGRVFEQSLSADRRASEELLPRLNELLRSAGAGLARCSRIAVCSGPGSFTGVRVGLATAWGLGRALGIPVEAVPTLEALAEAARRPGLERVTAALDAGRGDVVIQSFLLTEDRARPVSDLERLDIGRAQDRLAGREVACLPEGLLGHRSSVLRISPARAAALAVARQPRVTEGRVPVAIYARASAAEEKHGAA